MDEGVPESGNPHRSEGWKTNGSVMRLQIVHAIVLYRFREKLQ